MKKIDLNADIAEGFPFDEALLKLLSSANIACGLHAGGAKEMQSAVRFAKENQVRIGAHPGFPDRDNFGRIQMDLPAQELVAHLRYQLGALKAIHTNFCTYHFQNLPSSCLITPVSKNRFII